MGSIDIKVFSGMQPRRNPRVRTPSIAEFALDVDLDNGTLRAFRERLPVHTAPTSVLSFLRLDCCWISSDRCVDYAHPWPSCPYVVETGSSAGYPRIATFEQACAGNWCRLGNPCPTVAPIATPLQAPVGDQTLELRAYRYSFVNDFDQEGGGSPPSVVFDVNDGASVMLQLPASDRGEFCTKSIRIYRSATPFETGQEPQNPANTEWFLVDEVPVGTTAYLDTKRLLDLGGTQGQLGIFTMEEALPPPAGLHSIVALENGMLAGIFEGRLYMSEPFNPHSWPLRLVHKFYTPAIRLAAVGQALYVATNAHPYTVVVKQDSDGKGCMDVYKHRLPMPIASARSMTAGTAAAYYASKNGLVMVRANEARFISQTLISKRDWQALHPNLMLGVAFENYYYGFSDNIAIRFRTPEVEDIDPEQIAYTFLSDRPDAVWASPEGELYLANGNSISQWNASGAMRQYKWRSTPAYSPRRVALTAAELVIEQPGALQVDFITEKGTFTRDISGDGPVRLPNWFNSLFSQIEVRGTAEVSEATVATTIPALVRAGA